jgi:hypothetical protein
MQHPKTRKSFYLFRAKKYFTCLILAPALTTAMISTPRHPPHATILPHNYTSLFAAAHAAWPVAPTRAMYAPSRPNSPLADRHDPSADDYHSPHPMPAAGTNAPLTSSPLPNPFVDGCPPPAPSLYPTLALVAVPLRFFIFFLIYIIAHLTRLTQQTLALISDYLTVDPSALVLPPPLYTPHALPNSPVAAIMTD